MNRFLGCLMMATAVATAFAQGGTNSPYSQYGLGEISMPGVSQNKAMNGLGIALHEGNVLNTVNPASYADVDSLTMLFDMGLSASLTNFEENGKKKNARTGNFDYAVGSFRLWKNFGASFGVLPVTDVGYQYTSSSYLATAQNKLVTTYTGDGGMHKLFLGVGFRPLKNLSVGVNGGYLWGGYEKSVSLTGSQANTLYKEYVADVSNYTLDFGLQYDIKVSKEDRLTVGLTYGFGHKLSTDAECLIVSYNNTTGTRDSTHLVAADALQMPHTFGAGLAFKHGRSLTVGIDAEMQRWGNVKYPYESSGAYALKSGMLKDSYRFVAGTEWTPRYNGRSLLQRIRYRLGVGYTTPYYKIGEVDGPKQLSVSAGFGIPIQNQINARSYVHLSAQWVRQSVDGLLKENTFRINLGVTFNERWFAKWKVE